MNNRTISVNTYGNYIIPIARNVPLETTIIVRLLDGGIESISILLHEGTDVTGTPAQGAATQPTNGNILS